MIANALRIPVVFVAIWLAAPAIAHEVRPASLELTEGSGGRVDVVFKQPARGARGLPLAPRLPAHCQVEREGAVLLDGRAAVTRFRAECGPRGLRAGAVGVDGLSASLTDVAVVLIGEDGQRSRTLLRPESPEWVLSADPDRGFFAYFGLGVEHLVFGFDHVLFVLLLFFFVSGLGALVRTVTAFTVAHSLTLALSVLGWVSVPQPPVEAVIALSLVLLACEAIRADDGSSLRRRPWAVAFGFGLLHGLGFAGALTAVGLPTEDLAPALLMFNLGIEAGQVALVAVAWAGRRLLSSVTHGAWVGRSRAVAHVLAYAIGCLGVYWMIERTVPA